MGDADRLPMANVSRIVQGALPKDAAIAKEARVALSACATVFVHYVTELAVQQCDKRKKVTLTPEDILEALREAEFEDFEQPMKDALAQFRNGGGGAAKKGGNSAKKQKLDDSANGADTPTRPDQEVKEGEDEAEEAAGAAEGGAAPDDKMEEEADEDAAKDSADKDSDERVAEEKGKDDEEQDAAGGEGTDAPADNA